MKKQYIIPAMDIVRLNVSEEILDLGWNNLSNPADDFGAKEHSDFDFDFSDDPFGTSTPGGQEQSHDESIWTKNFWDD